MPGLVIQIEGRDATVCAGILLHKSAQAGPKESALHVLDCRVQQEG